VGKGEGKGKVGVNGDVKSRGGTSIGGGAAAPFFFEFFLYIFIYFLKLYSILFILKLYYRKL